MVDPGLAAVASPVLLIQAAAAFAELQVTCAEMSCFEPSEYRPVAVNWLVRPVATLLSGGPTAMEVSCAVDV
jgi:hypothetical protein